MTGHFNNDENTIEVDNKFVGYKTKWSDSILTVHFVCASETFLWTFSLSLNPK